VLQNFDVRRLMSEITLQGPDAQQAFDKYMGHVSLDRDQQHQVVGGLSASAVLQMLVDYGVTHAATPC